jgi:hypothetical protein
MNYPKPDDTLEGFTNTLQTYWSLEIRKNDTKMALVKILDWERKIHLLDDLPSKRIDKQVSPNVKILNYNPNSKNIYLLI